MEFEEKMSALFPYREEMADEERKIFDKMIDYANGRTEGLTQLESMLLGMLIEQQKKIQMLKVVA